MISISLWCSRALAVLLLPVFGAIASPAQTPAKTPAQRTRIADSYGRLPLAFEINRGQTDKRVRFLARGNGYAVFLTGKEAVLALHASPASDSAMPFNAMHQPSPQKTDVLQMQLIGANPSAEPHGAEPLTGTVSYFRGNDPSRWQSGISTFAKVEFTGVYPGIDLNYYGNQGQLEYDFVVAPNANPKTIRLHFAGASKLQVAATGDLMVRATNGRIVFNRPTVYQEENGRRRPVEGRFKLLADNSVGFTLGEYDHDRPLAIDPVLVYSTYLGGSQADEVDAIAVDSSGFAYVAGITQSADFPVTSGAFQTSGPSSHNSMPFVAKLNKTGTALVYSTYLGGSSSDTTYALALDSSGDAYVAGLASSLDFPVTAGAFQTTNIGHRAFISKLNPTGTALVYSTYLGGNTADRVNGMAVDASGSAYVTGITLSIDFPTTPGAFQTSNNDDHTAFVAKLHPDGASLDYSTYLGGAIQDEARGIAISGQGNAYVAGLTSSSDFPVTSGAFQRSLNATQSSNGFVTELNADGTGLVYSTFLGGSVQDEALAIALDLSGNAWVTGYSASTDFPVTSDAIQSTQGAVFVSKLNADGSTLSYSTFLGAPEGFGVPGGKGVAVGQSGDIFIAGTTGPGFPVTPGAFQTTGWAGASGFVTRLNATGTALVTSTYLGGSVGAFVNGLAIDTAGNAYVAGQTVSTDFPISAGAIQTVKKNGRFDGTGFVTKLVTNAVTIIGTSTALTSSANPATEGQNVIFDATVDALSGSSTPTGNVVFNIDATDVATVALTAGAASYHTTTLTAGSHIVKATYQGDSEFESSSSSLTETIDLPQAAAPTFSPAPGTYAASQSVVISDSTVGAAIYYTTNGSTPTTGSTVYTGPISVTATATIKAVATATGYTTSTIATGTYTIQNPGASITPGRLSFGNQTAGTTSTAQTATLQNSGNAALSISGITIAGTNPSEFSQTNNCGTSLAAGTSCSISVTFTPASAASYSATLSVNDTATGSPQTVALSGTGTTPPAPVASLTPPTLTFSTVTGTLSAAQPATLMNTGSAALTISGITIVGTNPSEFSQTNNCGTSLAADSSCTISVTFAPASAASYSATLSVADNATGSPHTVALSGTGLAAPTFTLSSSTPVQTVHPGGSAQFDLTVTAQHGSYAAPVTFSASGLPTGATATFQPSSVIPGNSSAATTLTVKVSSASASAAQHSFPWPLGSPALALLFFTIPRRLRRQWSRRVQVILLVLASLGAATAVTGCGGGFALPQTSVTSTITVKATSSSDISMTTVQLTVK